MRPVALFFALLPISFHQTTSQPIAAQPGIVVDKVVANLAAATAGIKGGDMITHWERGEAQGDLRSPFDITTVEIEQAPLGRVILKGVRGEEQKIWNLGPEQWGLQIRPQLPESLLTIYREASSLADAGNRAKAEEQWQALASQGEHLVPGLRLSLLFQIAGWQAAARQWGEADATYETAVHTGAAVGPEIEAQLLRAWAATFEQRSLWSEAEKHFREALLKDDLAGEAFPRALDCESLGRVAEKQGDLATAQQHYQESLAIRMRLAPGSLPVAASLNGLARIADDRSELDKAQNYAQQALRIVEKLAPGGPMVAVVVRTLGFIAVDRSDLTGGETYHRRALEIWQKLSPESLDVAACLTSLGGVALARGDLAKAEQYYRHAFEIRERLAPDSLELATSFTCLAAVRNVRDDLAKAEEFYRQALAIREKLAPDSLETAIAFSSLGSIALREGNLSGAAEYMQRALAIRVKQAPEGLDLASSLNDLASVAVEAGDLAKAEEYYKRALAIQQKLAPNGSYVALTLEALGTVALNYGDFSRAERYQRQAMAILQNLSPHSLPLAVNLTKLGEIFWSQGDLDKAEKYYVRGLAIEKQLAPGGLALAQSYEDLGAVAQGKGLLAKAKEYQTLGLNIREKLAQGSIESASSFYYLGLIELEQGNLAQAERHCRRALDIEDKAAPFSVFAAQTLNCLGAVAQRLSDPDTAEYNYRRAIAIWEKLAPASDDAAESFDGLASLARKGGDLEAAGRFFEEAIRALEGQMASFGGSEETRAGFRAKYENYYRGEIDVLVSQGKAELALNVLERSRARTLFEILTAAHVDIRKGAPLELVAKEQALQANLRAKSERRIRLLSETHSDEQASALEKEIGDLTIEYQDVENQIRSVSPAYAGLTQPEPLTAREIQERLLDPHTLLLEYSLGGDRSYLFAVSDTFLKVFTLPGRKSIETAAQRIYDLLTERNRKQNETYSSRKKRIARAEAEFSRAAASLSEMAIQPVAKFLAGKRLLIVGDGLLYYVPFQALPVAVPDQPPVPLVADHEIINLPSASVLAVLRREQSKRATTGKVVAILADPVFEKGDTRIKYRSRNRHYAASDARSHEPYQAEESERSRALARLTRSAADLGRKTRGGNLYLPRLKFTRLEAAEIAKLAPPGQVFEALDFSASRTTATSQELANYQIVHFATHSLMNNRHPELSGLVLSLVDEHGRPQNGFLDLRDIYNLNLPAELVVLSACETALGRRVEGEGLVGLMRGFMYAGAKRVLASLWSIDDQATADFMSSFYRAMLVDGMTPAAALHATQLRMRNEKRWSSPYYWASFQLQGEWEASFSAAKK